MTEEVQDVQPIQEEKPVENTDNFMDSLPSDAQDYIKKLRAENAANRVKKNEVNTKYEEAMKKATELDLLREETARNNGEFEKLYNAEKEKTIKLDEMQEKIQAYELTFAEQFDTVSKDLSPTQLALIEDAAMSIEKKLQWAIKLKGENRTDIDGPSIERPGGTSKNSSSILENFKSGNMEDRAKILFETKNINPKLYTQLLNL